MICINFLILGTNADYLGPCGPHPEKTLPGVFLQFFASRAAQAGGCCRHRGMSLRRVSFETWIVRTLSKDLCLGMCGCKRLLVVRVVDMGCDSCDRSFFRHATFCVNCCMQLDVSVARRVCEFGPMFISRCCYAICGFNRTSIILLLHSAMTMLWHWMPYLNFPWPDYMFFCRCCAHACT